MNAPEPQTVVSEQRHLPEVEGYDIIDEIGRGGMGTVYEAYQHATGRRVAVKLMAERGAADAVMRRRFEREVELVARLAHPHIVSVLDSGVFQGSYFYVMDYVNGRMLDQWMLDCGLRVSDCTDDRATPTKRQGAKPPIDAVLRVLAGICEAVDYAHQRGVLHRDLKPSNILIDERSAPHVLDFGLAKAIDPAAQRLDATLSEPGQLLGTLGYMAPEQARGDLSQISVRTDVYALGAIGYELLTGRLPCSVEGALPDALARIATEDPPPPSQVRQGIAPDLDAILLKSLEKDPQRRYATAGELAADVRRWLANEPVTARPASAWYQFRKFARRNKAWVAGVATTVAGLAIGLVTSLVLYFQAEAARAEAEQVALFHARVLTEIDAEKMGRGLVESLTVEVRAAMERRREAPEQIEANLRTLNDLMAGLNPTNVAVKNLDENIFTGAEQAVEKHFADQPLVQARLLQTIAVVLCDLGLLERAMSAQQKALEVRRRLLGSDHPDALISIDSMGSLLQAQGRLTDAESFFREGLERSRRVLGTNHLDTLASIHNLGFLLIAQGKLDDAEVYIREAMQEHRRALGDDDPRTLTALHNMGFLLQAQGRLTEAESCYRDVMTRRRHVLGDDHRDTIASVHNMGTLLQLQGKLAEAEPYIREALEKHRRILGDEHPRTIASLMELGVLLKAQGKLSEAEPYYHEAIEKFRRVLGNDHPDTIAAINNMGVLLQAQRKLPEAEACYREALERLRRALGDDHPNTLSSIHTMGLLLYTQGRLAEAEPYYREALEARRKFLGDDHKDTLSSINSMGLVLRAQGKLTEAEPYYREAVERCSRVFGKDVWQTAVSEAGLGQTLCDLSRYAEAEAYLLAAERVLRTPEGIPPGRYDKCLQTIVKLYDTWHTAESDQGHDAKADEWRAKLAEWQAAAQQAE